MVLAGLGMGLGVVASSATVSARRPIPPMRASAAGLDPASAGGDSLAAARAWARDAYPFGLRDCPRVTDDYYAACMDQMRQEALAEADNRAARERFAAFEPPPAYVPEPEVAPADPVMDFQDQMPSEPTATIPIGMPLPDDVDGQVELEVSSPPAG